MTVVETQRAFNSIRIYGKHQTKLKALNGIDL